MRVLAVTNLYPTDARPASGVFIEQQLKGLRELGLDVDLVFVDRATEGMVSYFRMLPRLRQSVQHSNPHLSHVMYGGVMADQVTRHFRHLPTVITFHGSDLLGENLSGLLRKLVSHYGIYCSRRAALRAHGLIIVAAHLRKALPATLDPERIRVIPCGIDLERFKPLDQEGCRRQLGWAGDCFHVLFPSNNGDPVKRPALAQAAVAALEAGGLRAELHYLRGIANAEVPTWLNASDVLILTSLHEGSPTVVKESLACNVPIVAVDVGDVAERIAGIDGCHLAAPRPDDLAMKLRLVHSRAGRVCGRNRMQALSLQSIAGQMERFYRELLDHTPFVVGHAG